MTALALRADDLVIEYDTKRGRVRSLDGATVSIEPGRLVALVGESGSGKTTLGMAAGRMLASNAAHVGGSLAVSGVPVYGSGSRADLRTLRRDLLGFVFQNPVAALNPTMRVERQLELAIGHRATTDDPAAMLRRVGLRDVPRVLRCYPHELSGGMAQRVGIAMALLRSPRLLVADEPTAAVDATLRAQILRLLVSRCRETGTALLLLTHDLRAVAEHTDRVAVMYGGRVVEYGETATVMSAPLHPYTQALINALPGDERVTQRLTAIPGVPPVLHGASAGCAFAPRCPEAMALCGTSRPVPAEPANGGRSVVCHLHEAQPAEPVRDREEVSR
jgi:peptide/nickel transport system ATP-binding protein